MITFEELPPVMATRARWAREQILTNKGTIEIDEEELLAWIYNEEDGLWYSIAGNYSRSSPTQKKERRAARKAKEEECWENSVKKYHDQAEYIKHWSAIRQQVLDRDKSTCQNCGILIGKFHVHHILPRRYGGEDFLDNLITVCPKCHSAVEKIAQEEGK